MSNELSEKKRVKIIERIDFVRNNFDSIEEYAHGLTRAGVCRELSDLGVKISWDCGVRIRVLVDIYLMILRDLNFIEGNGDHIGN